MSGSSQPVKKLGYLARRNLATLLDHSSPRGADWKGLCGRMEFAYDTIMALRAKESPTLALLDEWESAKGSTSGLLLLLLLIFDIAGSPLASSQALVRTRS